MKMKRIFVPLLFTMASSVWAGELKLTLHGTGIAGKNLYVAVHSLPEDFPARDAKAIKSAVAAKADATELLIPNVPKGEYAVAVFADMNGNGMLDSNFIGIPKEPVGVSRDAKGRFGPPKFADAAFKVGEGATALTIELK
jgi:uncharacterized protein (DUF2141 family)